MDTVRVRSIKDHVYAETPRKKGVVYDAEERFVAMLVGVGYVARADKDEESSVATLDNKVMDSEKTATGGRYNRRDMRPKE